MTALGYIRQSRRADLDVALSYDSQLVAIRRLAERDGIDPDGVRILSDMGRSGASGKERLRPAYQEVLAAIEAGGLDAIYALSLTRLARSTVELYRIAALAAARGVRLVFAKEGTMDPSSPIGKAQFGTMAVFAEFERDLAVERARDNVAERRRRGDRMGRLPYGERPGDQPEKVIAAFRATGSLNGAAKLLNDDRIPTALGQKRGPDGPRRVDWSGIMVRHTIARYAPAMLPRNPSRGVKPISSFALARLLLCPCGRFLTASRDGRGDRDVVYRCHGAETNNAHPRPYRVQEAVVLPWIMTQAARFNPRFLIERAASSEAERVRLEDELRGVGDAVVVRAYTVEQAAEKVAVIEAKLAALDDTTALAAVPVPDWSVWPPTLPDDHGEPQPVPVAALNAILRSYWRSVELDATMTPVRADWRFDPDAEPVA